MQSTKSKTLNTKQYQNHNIQKTRRYDLEDRTYLFSKKVYQYIKLLRKDMPNYEIVKQLVRSAGSVGANYIEANESLSKKDFMMRVKICRKEAKETAYWLKLTEICSKCPLTKEIKRLNNILKKHGL